MAVRLPVLREECSERWEVPLMRRPANALNIEIGKPLDRCRLKTPDNWGDADPRAARWLMSGGDPLVLGKCSPDCPKNRDPAAYQDHEAAEPDSEPPPRHDDRGSR